MKILTKALYELRPIYAAATFFCIVPQIDFSSKAYLCNGANGALEALGKTPTFCTADIVSWTSYEDDPKLGKQVWDVGLYDSDCNKIGHANNNDRTDDIPFSNPPTGVTIKFPPGGILAADTGPSLWSSEDVRLDHLNATGFDCLYQGNAEKCWQDRWDCAGFVGTDDDSCQLPANIDPAKCHDS